MSFGHAVFVSDEAFAESFPPDDLYDIHWKRGAERDLAIPEAHIFEFDNSFTTLTYEYLFEIATGREADTGTWPIEPAYEGEGDEWTYRVAEAMVSVLADASEADLEAWLDPWMATDEMPPWNDEELRSFLRDQLDDLRRLATVAAETDRDLYYWISL